jgi:glucose/mannose-6-phosphate isomerase
MNSVRPNLDDLSLYTQTDPSGSYERLMDTAGQVRAAWQLALDWTPPALPVPPRAVVVAGMGGSAIGGDLVRALAADQATVPIIVHRDYGLPAYAGAHTLVLASSYSGNTEETLSAAEEAQRRGAPLIAVTTGGELARRAKAWGTAMLAFYYPAQPREVLGYSMALLLGTLVRLGLLPDPTPEIGAAATTLEGLRREIERDVPTAHNPAKEMAHWLCGYVPAVYGSGLLAPVAKRWRGQFQENAKSWAEAGELPEIDHNVVCGTEQPAGFTRNVRGVFLASALDHPRNRLRLEATRQLFEEAGIACRTAAGQGDSPLAQMLTAVLLGDAVSYYLAMLYGMDPGTIPAIVKLKEVLSRETTG